MTLNARPHPPVLIREFRLPADYEGTLRLWSEMEQGVKVGRSDTLEEIEKKLQRDPDLFLVADINDRIVGTVMGGFDGRRGMIYHLAVDVGVRNRGIANELMEEVERRLQSKGCVKCYLLVLADNQGAIRFYEHRGWVDLKENRLFGKEFP